MCIPHHDFSNVTPFPGRSPAIDTSTATADVCVECGRQIESRHQLAYLGTDVCERCAGPQVA